MENTNKTTRRGKRSAAGARTRGGVSRPSVSAPIFSGTLESLQEGYALEKALHQKRVRVLPPKVPTDQISESLWSSLISGPSTREAHHEEEIEMVPSPAQYVECGESTPEGTPKACRSGRALDDDEIFALISYGSEQESGKEEDEEGITQCIMVPRVARMFIDEEEEEVQSGCATIDLEWPPRPTRPSPSSLVSPPPASPPHASPPHASPPPALPSPASLFEPSDKFKFNWRGFSMPQIEPHLRREPFSQNIGPMVCYTTPYDAFIAIWDRDIIERIVRETNIYAQQLRASMLEQGTIRPNSRITRWQDTHVNEVYRYLACKLRLHVYLAIVLAMGVIIKSRLEEYWNMSKDIFNTPAFSTEMSFDRIQLLSKCLHFNNNFDCDPAVLTQSQAKLYKFQPVLDHLNTKFSQLYNLSQNIALDESLTIWKGWLDTNQFIRNKAATVGIKTYEVR